MSMPKLLTVEQVAEAMDLSVATLDRYRANGTGPNFLKVGDGGNIRYLESDVIAYLESCRQLPPIDGSKASSPRALQEAVTSGFVGVKQALKERNDAMKKMDADDRVVTDPYAVTVGGVGETPGAKIEYINNVPPIPFSNEPAPHILEGR